MLARVPPFSTPRAAAGQRRGLSDGVVAQFEAAGDTAPGSGLGGARRPGRGGSERLGNVPLRTHDGYAAPGIQNRASTDNAVEAFQKAGLSTAC